MDGGFDWIQKAVETNETPIFEEVDVGHVVGKLGRRVNLRAGSVTASVRLIGSDCSSAARTTSTGGTGFGLSPPTPNAA
jgi:hypothetical protein